MFRYLPTKIIPQIGCINVSLAALNAMSKVNGGNGGVVVNVASVAGLVPIAMSPFYNASKHGVIGFTRTLAVSSSNLDFMKLIERVFINFLVLDL